MSQFRIPGRPPMLGTAGVQIGAPVSSTAWRAAAESWYYTAYSGAQVVATTYPNVSIASASRHDFSIRIFKRAPVLEYEWVFIVRTTAVASSTLTVLNILTGATADFTIYDTIAQSRPLVMRDPLLAQTAKGADNLTIGFSCPDAYVIEAIACYEVPRTLAISTNLHDPTIDGVDTDDITMGWLALKGQIAGDNGRMLNSLVGKIDEDHGTRSAHFHWVAPYAVAVADSTAFAIATTAASGAPDNVFHLGVPVLSRAWEVTTSTGLVTATKNVQVAALMKCDASTNASLRVTASSGATVTLTHTTAVTTWTWRTGTLAINTEDIDDPLGLRGGAWDDLTFAFWRSSGAGTCYVAGIAVYEFT